VGLSPETKGLLKGVPIISTLGIILGFVFVSSSVDETARSLLAMNVNFVIGVVIGVVAALGKMLLLEFTISRALYDKTPQKASLYMGIGYLLRFAITGLSLFIAVFFFGTFGIFGALVAAISQSVSAYAIKLFTKKAQKGGE